MTTVAGLRNVTPSAISFATTRRWISAFDRRQIGARVHAERFDRIVGDDGADAMAGAAQHARGDR